MDCQKLLREFLHFVKRNRYVILLLGIFTCLIHGDKLFSTNNGIDTEKIIFEGEEIYESWLGIGRQGLVFLKWMLGQRHYNPYFAGMLALLFLAVSTIVFTFLFELVRSERGGDTHKPGQRFLTFAFGLLLITHPILTEQLYFSLQGAEVTLAFILCGVSLLFAHRRHLLLGMLFLLPALGVYQAMAPLYLFGIVALVCLHGMCVSGGIRVKEEVLYAARLTAVFLSSFVLNQMITGMFFSKTRYLTNQIQWNREQIWEGILRITSHVRDVFLGNGIFYFAGFFWLAVGLAMVIIWKLFLRENFPRKNFPVVPTEKEKVSKQNVCVVIWNLLLVLALYASPFYLTIVLGERPVIRGQLALPFVMGFLAYLLGVLLQESEKNRLTAMGKLFLSILVLYTVWQETDVTCRLYYTDAVRYQEDLWLAGNLEQDVIKFTGKCDYRGTVVFIGKRKAPGNCASLTGDVMGQSLFAWDTDVEPVNFWSSSRIIGFMHCMGTNYRAPTAEQTALALEASRDMPCYPADGSMAWCGDMVVVKLSEE